MAYNANVSVPAPRPLPRVWATAVTTSGRLEGPPYDPNMSRGGPNGVNEWLMGVKFAPFGHENVTGHEFDWCVPRLTTAAAVECDEVEFEPFVMELAMTAPTRYDGDEFLQYLVDHSVTQRTHLLAAQVERAALVDNPSLASSALIIANADQSALGALIAVEDALADVLDGGLGMIHMTPGIFSALAVQGGFRLDENGIWRTATGHAIAADAGYLGVDPDTEATVAGELWMYGSGPVFAKVDAPITLVTANPWERIDVLSNRYVFDVEQHAIAIFDPDTVVAAKINTADSNFLTEGGSGGGDASAANQATTIALLNPTLGAEAFTADETIAAANYYHGITVRNADAGVSRVTIHHGANSSAPVIDYIDLAIGETLPLRMLTRRLPTPDGIHVEVVSGTVTGSLIYEA